MRAIIHILGYVPGKITFKIHLWRRFAIRVSKKKIAKLMYDNHIVAELTRKNGYLGQDTHFHECMANKNIVNQDFRIGPRRVILTDITYLFYNNNSTRSYLCVFKDAFTKEILGYSVSQTMTTQLVRDAFNNMMDKHRAEIRQDKISVFCHSDSGSQYLSCQIKQLLTDENFIQSTSRRSNSFDNSPCESFFSRFKNEILRTISRCKKYEDVVYLIDGYMDNYNNERYQYELAGLSPREFYGYSMTGIYPLDSYFGVECGKLISVDEIVKKQLDKQNQNYEKKKNRGNYKIGANTNQQRIEDPKYIMIRDKKKLKKEIDKNLKIAHDCMDICEEYLVIYKKADKAEVFYDNLSPNDKLIFKDPTVWVNYKETSYVKDMADMF